VDWGVGRACNGGRVVYLGQALGRTLGRQECRRVVVDAQVPGVEHEGASGRVAALGCGRVHLRVFDDTVDTAALAQDTDLQFKLAGEG
jgi:hypothetical protein